MERSSYLDFFQREAMAAAYKSPEEAQQEEILALLALMQLAQKLESGLSPALAAGDWALIQLHLKQRRKLSGEKGIESRLSQAARRFSLNRAEYVALLLAYGARKGLIRPEHLSRLRGDRKKEAASIQAAEVLYGYFLKLEDVNQNKEEPEKPEKQSAERRTSLPRPHQLEFCFAHGWKREASGTGAENALELRGLLWEWLEGGIPGQEAWEGRGGMFRRRSTADPLPPVLAYQELLQQMIRMQGGKEEHWNLVLVGEKGSGKEFLAWHLAAARGQNLLVIQKDRVEALKHTGAYSLAEPEIREKLMEAVCACLLWGDLLYWENPEEGMFLTVRDALPGLLLLGEEPGEENLPNRGGKRTVSLELPALSLSQKEKLWSAFLAQYPHSGTLKTSLLASKYVMNPGEMKKALYGAWKKAEGAGLGQIGEEELTWSIGRLRRGQLGSYALQVPCIFSWNDLMVEEKVKRQLEYLCGQVKYRGIVGEQWGFFEKMPYGRGLCALFYGPPGTGKTMATQVIARELGMDLYRVDLSRMVSKYIGETEKHISSLFEKAKQMNIILFFDEADSFFSKRSEIKDANDRNANSEVAHLLQKLEEYEGITILATNLKDNMDEAFKRRISFMIHFRQPSRETRRKLWHSLLPKKAPREENLDLDLFAERFELSGSQIKEILLAAAYIAAAEGKAIGNRQIKEALCLNYEKYGKTVTEEDFGYLAE